MADSIHHETCKKETPHEALFLTLTYLPLFELLSISETCSSMKDAVFNDVLPWIHITVDRPLSYRLSDLNLIKYASKANGRLRSLVMVKCVNITDDGLKQVIAQNPFISKLHVPGCTGLTPDGVVTVVKTLSKWGPNLTTLKVNGIYNINKQHFLTLRSLLTENIKHSHFLPSEQRKNDTPIDIDICPRCEQVRLVFKCSEDNCNRKMKRGVSECKGCSHCIARCVDCRKCIDEHEETIEAACEDTLCLECWLKLPKCNLCNKPYCKDHTEQRNVHTDSGGFVCDGCVANCSWSYD